MSINLAIESSMPAGAVSNLVQYARIDNITSAPVFTTVSPNPVTSPAVIATNLPNGVYEIQATPIYPDGRTCQPTITTTPGCPGLISLSAVIQTGVLVVTYLAPSGAPSVLINVNYPNGGSFSQVYTNTGNPISIGLPSGVYGNYSVNGQAVCDPTSSFYSPPSASVSVPYTQAVSGSYYLGNSVGAVCANNTPTTLYSNGAPITGTVLYTDSALTNEITGYSFVSYQGVIYNLDPVEGTLGANTGQNCNVQITGNTGLSAGLPNGNGTIVAVPGRVVNVTISTSGPPGGTYSLNFTIPSLGVSQSVSNGSTTFTFTMPSSGSVNWIAIYTSTNSNGGGGITVS
jgi:hypothetical protein